MVVARRRGKAINAVSPTLSFVQRCHAFAHVMTVAARVEMAAMGRECANEMAGGALSISGGYHDPNVGGYTNGGVELKICDAYGGVVELDAMKLTAARK